MYIIIIQVYLYYIYTVFSVYRVTRQNITPAVSVLGGISYKALLPADVEALSVFLRARGLDVLLHGSLTTLYRVIVHGQTYYSRAYERVKKRNSCTVTYLDSGTDARKFGFIEYFVYLYSIK